jgi:hypothetical protein
MHFIPVAMSLLASFMSAITLLGTPAEMYNFTTMYWYIGISYFFVMFMAAHIYIPIFYNLKVTSAYEVRYIIVSNLNMKRNASFLQPEELLSCCAYSYFCTQRIFQ